jgi:hypothetical protein
VGWKWKREDPRGGGERGSRFQTRALQITHILVLVLFVPFEIFVYRIAMKAFCVKRICIRRERASAMILSSEWRGRKDFRMVVVECRSVSQVTAEVLLAIQTHILPRTSRVQAPPIQFR